MKNFTKTDKNKDFFFILYKKSRILGDEWLITVMQPMLTYSGVIYIGWFLLQACSSPGFLKYIVAT